MLFLLHKPSKKHLCLHEKQLANRKEVKYFGKKVRRPQTLANTGMEGHQKQKYSHFDLKISILRAKSPSTSGKKIRGQKKWENIEFTREIGICAKVRSTDFFDGNRLILR